MTTIKLVLECASGIEYFSIIINKLSKPAYIYLVKDNGKHLKILVAEIIEQVNWKLSYTNVRIELRLYAEIS